MSDARCLSGRIAIITGAARGIGRATAARFADAGATVVLADIDDERVARAAAAIRDRGEHAEHAVVDIADASAVDALVESTCERFGQVDILHNNAYVLGAGRVGEVERDVWQHTIDVCLTAYWYCTKAVLAPMVARGRGVIINTASVSGLAADYTLAAYSAAKAGVVNLTRSTAIEYARKGIRCNAICPGPVWTHGEHAFGELPPDVAESLVRSVPMGRLGRPAEVAELALFLASDDSSFMTGGCCVIDGGMSAHTGMPSLSGVGADW